jgi:hypothetical protein
LGDERERVCREEEEDEVGKEGRKEGFKVVRDGSGSGNGSVDLGRVWHADLNLNFGRSRIVSHRIASQRRSAPQGIDWNESRAISIFF